MDTFIKQLQACPQPWPTLTIGKRHWFVKLLRRVLAERGFGKDAWKDPSTAVSDYFDSELLDEVRLFQSSQQLKLDGIVGVSTWHALAHGSDPGPTAHTWQPDTRDYNEALVRSTAADYNEFLVALGVSEHGGANRGEVVDAVNRHTLGQTGQFWCLTVQDFCIDTSCKVHHCTPPLDIGASASSLHSRAEHAQRLVQLASVKRGHIFLVPGGPTGWQHGGMVLEVLAGGKLRTCEGNSNDDGSSNGYEMCIRTRKAAGLAFVDWSRP